MVTSSAVTLEWLYVFVDPTNSMAVMNLTITGRYSSSVLAALDDKSFAQAYANGTADFLPVVPNPSVSTGFMSPFVVGTINSYRVEYDAELARRAFFPDAARLGAHEPSSRAAPPRGSLPTRLRAAGRAVVGRVEVRPSLVVYLVVVHPDHDAVERADPRHDYALRDEVAPSSH